MPVNSLYRTPNAVVLFGVFEADLRSGELRKNGVKVRIQDLPFRALKLLLSRPNEVITREEFRQALWPGDVFVDFDLGIRSAIKRLRDALGDSAENPIFVETIDRRGYRWIAATHVSEAASAARTTPESEDSDPASGAKASAVETPARDSATQTTKTQTTKKTIRIVGLVGGLAIVMAVAWLRGTYWKQGLFGKPDSSVVLRSVAVLPFQNAGSDKDADFLRLALPDEVANVLSCVPSLSIRPFATTSRYSGANLDLQQAGREMGVASIVMGHYLIAGDQLEITLEAVDVANNRSVWRDTVSVAASDKIAMREQITSQVRQGLVPALGGSSAPWEAGTRPKSEEAYDL